MKSLPQLISAAVLIAAGIAMLAPSPGASSEHFVIVNNNDSSGNNYGTVLQLGGTRQNPVLSNIASLSTGVAVSGVANVPQVQVVRVGGDVCVFLADATSNIPNEISSFKFPGMTLVGNYSNSNVPDDDSTQAIAAGGGYLFATYGSAIASWAIGSECTLTVAQTYSMTTPRPVAYMAVTPDGKTLILTAAKPSGLLHAYSFSIGTGGTLAEHGPYLPDGYGPSSFDITADGKWVYFAVGADCPISCEGTIVAMSINSDGTLSGGQRFIFGSLAPYLVSLRFSPNEQYLFVDGFTTTFQAQVYTLNFTENPPDLTYTGCTTNPSQNSAVALATVSTTGAGGGLYVAEGDGVGLFTIDPSTGCTTEVPNSPFSLSDPNAAPVSLVAWPPRPF